MGKPDRSGADCDADFLRNVVARAHDASNHALVELAHQRQPATLCATQADFHYADPGGADRGAHVIPIAQFHRQYQLCLEALELTIYGYCVFKEFGWERRVEPVFSLRRPPVWRRAVRAAPLLAFSVNAQEGEVVAAVGPANRPGYANKRNCFIRLDRELQDQMVRIHDEQATARSLKTRLVSFFRRFRRN